MAGMSLLRPSFGRCFLQSLQTAKSSQVSLQRKAIVYGQVSVRNAGHERKMVIVPSRFDWQRFKDDLHFYLLLGLLPMFAVITYANMFIGPAKLSDIPKGYEPQEWEYYESPIKRWFAKYVYQPPNKEYEKTLHYLHFHREQRYWNMLEKKVKTLMSDRQDYKGWYWINREKSVTEARLAAEEDASKMRGTP